MSVSRSLLSHAVALAFAAQACFAASAMADTTNQEQFFPPWSHGANNPVQDRGLEFTVPEVDNLPDFHGDPMNARLVILVGGNYYFAMAPLVHEFERQHPEFKGKIYYETIPPGLCYEQIKKHGTVTVGNMTWTVHPDVYAAGLKRVTQAIDEGYGKAPAVRYATNTLTIMIPKGNPAHITSLNDLGKPGVKLVMPNPEFEGIGRQIKAALAKAGGEALVTAVYDTKVKNGETILTHIHHRQSPLYLMLGRAQAGVTWQSEAIFQEETGNPISHVNIPDAQNVSAIYAATPLKAAPHKKAAQMWVDYLHSPKALEIFEHFGFKPYTATK
ncbi:MAG: substrate-binding domain-containing protein [Betaproteobacteria bacterium]|nr:substrate-binding domain-containing protein [Betaproteobacteria bacterium]